jgi:hypothetical protein
MNDEEGQFEGTIGLSFDLDWAPDYVLEALFELLAPLELPVTFFCTHTSPAVRRLLSLPGSEAGLHPNLQDADDEEGALSSLGAIFPGATGIRVHRLYYHSGLLPLFHRQRLEYLSNDLMHLEAGLAPHYDWSGMIRLPIYWEDDVHALLSPGDYSPARLALGSAGMKVMNFHPIHLFLNTDRFERYEGCRDGVADRAFVEPHRNRGAGIRTLFEELTAEISKERFSGLGEIAAGFRERRPAPVERRSLFDPR